MTIFVKNKHTLKIDEFKFKCCIGKKGSTRNKKEGDMKTPIGIFKLGHLYYRNDRISLPKTNLKYFKITKNMGWCNDETDTKNYNKLTCIKVLKKYEKLYRKDYKYNLLIPIKYNFKKPILGKGSCIFLHLTKSYTPTAGCVALSEKDFRIMLKIIKPSSLISIY